MSSTSPQPPAPDETLPGATFQPAERFLISTPEQLRAISDPLRLRIIEQILHEALTVKQIATRLEQPPTKLYYHVAELEEAGFVTMVDTRVKSGIIEKYYRASAGNISVHPTLLNQATIKDNVLTNLLAVIFDATTQEVSRSLASGLINLDDDPSISTGNYIVTRSLFHIPKDELPMFMEKFKVLFEELGAAEERAGPDSPNYACTIVFYPRVDYGKQE